MTPDALSAAGIIDDAGHWTGKYGIHSRAQFLANPSICPARRGLTGGNISSFIPHARPSMSSVEFERMG
jgi:hypothetical protein